jgi:hypothetical protein
MRARLISAAVAVSVLPIPAIFPPPSEPPPPDNNCKLELASLDTDRCTVLASDTGRTADPTPLWGQLSCGQFGSPNLSRHHRVRRGGDPHPTATGDQQGGGAYRRLVVRDGDDFSGERCELGRNSHEPSDPTFMLYREGEHRATFVSLRLPKRFPLRRPRWQTVWQMKQAQPSANGGGGPMIEVQAFAHRFWLINDHQTLWSTQARRRVWTRFAIDVRYSQDPSKGTLKVYVDNDGDGDASGEDEESPLYRRSTLRTETDGGDPDDGIAPGEPIPDHLRVGIYHDPVYPCERPRSCAIHVDNVQVMNAQGASSPD